MNIFSQSVDVIADRQLHNNSPRRNDQFPLMPRNDFRRNSADSFENLRQMQMYQSQPIAPIIVSPEDVIADKRLQNNSPRRTNQLPPISGNEFLTRNSLNSYENMSQMQMYPQQSSINALYNPVLSKDPSLVNILRRPPVGLKSSQFNDNFRFKGLNLYL